FVTAIRALVDFRYLAQAPIIDEFTITLIEKSLQLFHQNKKAIIDAGARRGKKGPIEHWQIPKLEFLQSVVSNIRYNGVAIQWTADTTEHAHILVVKDPVSTGNNQAYEPQICRYLDRLDKINNFDLGTSIVTAGVDFRAPSSLPIEVPIDEDDEESSLPALATTSELLASLLPTGYHAAAARRALTDYFYRAKLLRHGLLNNCPSPPRTLQSADNVVYHLSRDPNLKRLTVDEAAITFQLPDLRSALSDYLKRLQTHGFINTVGGRRLARTECSLPFTQVEVWSKLRLQTRSYHFPHSILPPVTINALPPSPEWPQGRRDPVILSVDPSQFWPKSGLDGHIVVDMCLIFRIVAPPPDLTTAQLREKNVTDCFLAYVHRYNIISQSVPGSSSSVARGAFPDPSTSLYALKKGTRTTGELIGDIVPLDQIRALADITPRLGHKADQRLTKENSIAYSNEFWLNKYFDKELFYALTLH
ncbi:hypothetical protein CPB83DRAFT_778363, partial [Crepidotus variabilis]